MVKEAVGTVVCRPFAGSSVIQPAVELDDGSWYWISPPRDGKPWPADPGQRVRVRYHPEDQFCNVVEEPASVIPMRKLKVGDVVRFVRVVDPGDEQCRFVITEHNGDRLMIQLMCDLPIRPVKVAPTGEVTLCEMKRPRTLSRCVPRCEDMSSWMGDRRNHQRRGGANQRQGLPHADDRRNSAGRLVEEPGTAGLKLERIHVLKRLVA